MRMNVDKIKKIPTKEINKLPKATGVYLLYGSTSSPQAEKRIIYIGKAINIKNRVKNHFQGKNWWEKTLLRQGFGGQVGFIETNSEIEALILEAELIKKYQPKFNVVWRDDKNYFYVAISGEKLPSVFITHQREKSQNTNHKIQTFYIGPFVDGNSLKKTLKLLRKVFPFYTSAIHPKRKCTWCHLDLCPGPEPDLKEYRKNIKKLILVLQGKRKNVLRQLKKEMKLFSNSQEFEKAGKTRNKIEALQSIISHAHVIDYTLKTKGSLDLEHKESWQKTEENLKNILNLKGTISRIECYDISNIQGKQATGSMVVFTNGKPDKNQYKKFRIRMKNEPNDIAMLREVLKRRFTHTEWKYPEVILIDGGKAQLNVAIKSKGRKKIKIISIAKGRQELFIEGKKKPIPLKNLTQNLYNLIKHLDDEAHRFAITYHRKLRKKDLGIDI